MSDKKVTIEEARKMVREFRKARGWVEDQNTKNKAISLVVEAVELLEHFQWRETDEVVGHVERKAEVVDELADVLYWVLSLADALEVDLSEALKRKLKKGGKKYPARLFRSGSDKKDLKTYYQLRDRVRSNYSLKKNDKEGTREPRVSRHKRRP